MCVCVCVCVLVRFPNVNAQSRCVYTYGNLYKELTSLCADLYKELTRTRYYLPTYAFDACTGVYEELTLASKNRSKICLIISRQVVMHLQMFSKHSLG